MIYQTEIKSVSVSAIRVVYLMVSDRHQKYAESNICATYKVTEMPSVLDA